MLLVHRRKLNRGAEVTVTSRMTLVNQHTCGRKHGQRIDDALRATVRRALTVTLRFDDSATAGKLLSSRAKTTRATMASSTIGLRRGFQLGLSVARLAHGATEARQTTTKCTSTGFGRVSTCQTLATTQARRGEPQGGGSRHRRSSSRRNGRRRGTRGSAHGSSSEDDSDGAVVQYAGSRRHRIKPRTFNGSG